MRLVPEPPVAPRNAGVGPHGTEQRSTLPEVQRWPWRPHGDTDYKSLCRETDSVVIRGSARQGFSVSVRLECFSFFSLRVTLRCNSLTNERGYACKSNDSH